MGGFWSTETLRDRIPDLGLIDPYDPNRVVNCSYELKLGDEAFVTGDNLRTKLDVSVRDKIRIPPGQFAHLLTLERVRVPADAIGFISVRFRLKKCGLVNVSGFHVDPGYNNTLIFSVYNAGPREIAISKGDEAFLLWYCSLDDSTGNLYKGSRSEPMGIGSADVEALLGEVATPQVLARRIDEVEGELKQAVELFDKRMKTARSWIIGIGSAVAGSIGGSIAVATFV